MQIIKRTVKSLARRVVGPDVKFQTKEDHELMARYVARSLMPESLFVEVGAFTGESGREFREMPITATSTEITVLEPMPCSFVFTKQSTKLYRTAADVMTG